MWIKYQLTVYQLVNLKPLLEITQKTCLKDNDVFLLFFITFLSITHRSIVWFQKEILIQMIEFIVSLLFNIFEDTIIIQIVQAQLSERNQKVEWFVIEWWNALRFIFFNSSLFPKALINIFSWLSSLFQKLQLLRNYYYCHTYFKMFLNRSVCSFYVCKIGSSHIIFIIFKSEFVSFAL